MEESDGKVGVRNEIWIIPTVGCVDNIATAMAKRANAKVKGSVQEVIAFPHPYGCSQMGDDQEHTRTILADLINHPNAGGVLVLGLGCENSNIDVLKPYIGDYDEKRVKFLVCQEVEGEMAGTDQRFKTDHWHEVRWKRWIFRHYRKSSCGKIFRSSDQQKRNDDPHGST